MKWSHRPLKKLPTSAMRRKNIVMAHGSTPTHDGQGYVEIENAEFFATGIYCTPGCHCVVYHVPNDYKGETLYIQAYEYFPDFVLYPLLTL